MVNLYATNKLKFYMVHFDCVTPPLQHPGSAPIVTICIPRVFHLYCSHSYWLHSNSTFPHSGEVLTGTVEPQVSIINGTRVLRDK